MPLMQLDTPSWSDNTYLLYTFLYRVIGTWDKQKHILKCVTVRPSTPQEDKCITQAIQMCDKAMRQFTCSTNEI